MESVSQSQKAAGVKITIAGIYFSNALAGRWLSKGEIVCRPNYCPNYLITEFRKWTPRGHNWIRKVTDCRWLLNFYQSQHAFLWIWQSILKTNHPAKQRKSFLVLCAFILVANKITMFYRHSTMLTVVKYQYKRESFYHIKRSRMCVCAFVCCRDLNDGSNEQVEEQNEIVCNK